MLGSIDRGHVTRLVELLAERDGATLLDEISSLDEMAPDYGAVLEELMTVLQRIAVAQLVGGERLDDDDEQLRLLAGTMQPEDVQLYYQIAVNGRRDINVARDERVSFEMTMLRMLAFTLDADRPPAVSARAPEKTAGKSGAGSSTRAPAAGNVHKPARSGKSAAPPPSLVDAAGDWPALLQAAGIRGPARGLAEHCVVASVDGSRLELTLATDKADFNTEKLRERLRSALSAYVGSEIRLAIAVGTPEAATPAQIHEDSESRRMQATREAIEADPTVRAVQAAFDAVLEPDSIQPAGKSSPKQ
jgi:DNA polymerase-3 subunit gamma/tau